MKIVGNIFKTIFSFIFDPISSIFEVDLGYKEAKVTWWKNIIIGICALAMAVGIILLYYFVIHKQ